MSLTQDQKAEVASIIDSWYLHWKCKIVDGGVTHRFGFAKEELKQRIFE